MSGRGQELGENKRESEQKPLNSMAKLIKNSKKVFRVLSPKKGIKI